MCISNGDSSKHKKTELTGERKEVERKQMMREGEANNDESGAGRG